MIQTGQNITKADDALTKVQTDYLFHQIQSPKQEILSKIRQLRIIKSIDIKQFTLLKKQLPYVVCGIFNPPFRRTENFGYIESFIVDLDHFSGNNKDLAIARKEIEQDPRTLLSFISPSEDGLKLMFRLKEKCYDAGKYSLFYKCFIRSFALQYHLDQLIDARTSDVTRACFVSYDEAVYYNEVAEPIDMSQYLDFENPASISEIKAELEHIEKDKQKEEIKEKGPVDPDNESMLFIRSKLNPKLKKLDERPVFVPIILNDIMEDLQVYMTDLSFTLLEVKDIQYGKKLRFSLGNKQSEINLFYGKRGFSVVQSPKTGTSFELNQLSADCISNYLSERGYQ